MDEITRDEQGRVAAFVQSLADVAARMGGVTVVSASVACQAAFGPLEKMTAFEQRSVNRILASYRLHLDFPAIRSHTAVPLLHKSDDEKATRLVDMLAAVASPETGAGLSLADAEVVVVEVYGDADSLSAEQLSAVRLAVSPYGLEFESGDFRERPAD